MIRDLGISGSNPTPHTRATTSFARSWPSMFVFSASLSACIPAPWPPRAFSFARDAASSRADRSASSCRLMCSSTAVGCLDAEASTMLMCRYCWVSRLRSGACGGKHRIRVAHVRAARILFFSDRERERERASAVEPRVCTTVCTSLDTSSLRATPMFEKYGRYPGV